MLGLAASRGWQLRLPPPAAAAAQSRWHSGWWPWREPARRAPACQAPAYPRRPEAVHALGERWTDAYAWVGREEASALEPLLRQEQRHFRWASARWEATTQALLSAARRLCAPEQCEVPERVGAWEYTTAAATAGDDSGVPCFMRRRGPGDAWQVLLDGALVARHADTAARVLGRPVEGHDVGQVKLSRDQALLAFTLATDAGGEGSVGCVVDLDTGQLLPGGVLPGARSLEWSAHSGCIAYTAPDAAGRDARVLLRSLPLAGGRSGGGGGGGEGACAADVCVFKEHDPAWFVTVTRTKDWAGLLLNSHSKLSSEVHWLDATQPLTPPVCIQRRARGVEYFAEHWRGRLYILTNAGQSGADYLLASAPAPGSRSATARDAPHHHRQPPPPPPPCPPPPPPPPHHHHHHHHHQPQQLQQQHQQQQHGECGATADADAVGGSPAALLPPGWRLLLPEREGVAVADMDMFDGRLVLHELRGGVPGLSAWNLREDGGGLGTCCQVPLPPWALHLTPGANQDPGSATLRVQLSSPTRPPAAYDFAFASGELRSAQQSDPSGRPGPATDATGVAGNGGGGPAVGRAAPAAASRQAPPRLLADGSSSTSSSSSSSSSSSRSGRGSSSSGSSSRAGAARRSRAGGPHGDGSPPASWVCVERLRATARDGVGVPLTLMLPARCEQRRGGGMRRPLLVCVYGAYGQPLPSEYDPLRLALVERGWAVALAHVRGGGEGGRRWHAAGRQQHKHRSASDLLACLHALISAGHTEAGLIAGHAYSAGAFALGAALNSEPELFGAALLQAPFLDVLASMLDPSHLLTPHEVDEWGDPSTDAGALAALRALCPYHNLRTPAGGYPPVLVTAGLRDERVPYWGPVRYVAKLRALQEAAAAGAVQNDAHAAPAAARQEGAAPSRVLLDVEAEGGHHRSQQGYHDAQGLAFLAHCIEPKAAPEWQR